jgi:hypothetical protein
MELRVTVGVGEFRPDDDRTIELLDVLRARLPDWGPVMSWSDGEATFTVSNDWPAPLWAAGEAATAVGEALETVAGRRQDDELIEHFARVLDVELVSHDE